MSNALQSDIVPAQCTGDVQLVHVVHARGDDSWRWVRDEQYFPAQQPACSGCVVGRDALDDERLSECACGVHWHLGEVAGCKNKHSFVLTVQFTVQYSTCC